MPENRAEDSSCSLSGVPGDRVIAFAYIKVLNSGKRRFFVLKSVPRASTSELEGSKPQVDHHLYMYKSEKGYQKNELKHAYNLSNMILLSQCTRKENKTVLNICFPDAVLLLKFSAEDELQRWYFHLNELQSALQNYNRPELQHCFGVTVKARKFGSPRDRERLTGQFRFCLTESAVLLVKDNLRDPELNLPFQAIRSVTSSPTFFQLHSGRLSSIGEGELRFEMDQSCLLSEAKDAVDRCLKEASVRSKLNGSRPSSHRGARRSSRGGGDDDSVHRVGYQPTVLRRGGSVRNAKQHGTKSISTFSERGTNASNLQDSQRTSSQPLSENVDDYCDLSLDLQPAAPSTNNHSSIYSSTSLSVNSELASGTDAGQQPYYQPNLHQQPKLRQPQENLVSTGPQDSCISRVEIWRQTNNKNGVGGGGSDGESPALGTRANSLGSRPPPGSTRLQAPRGHLPNSQSVPPSSYGVGEAPYSVSGGGVSGGGGGHRDDRQVFVEISLPTCSDPWRPRTSSDAARYRMRSRAGSYGNSSGGCAGHPPRSTTLEEILSDAEGLSYDKDNAGSYVSMTLRSSTERKEDTEAETIPEEDDPYACWSSPSQMDRMFSASSPQECPVEH